MSDKQPEALRLAQYFERETRWHPPSVPQMQAAAELRRLHALNAELVEALRDLNDLTRHPDYGIPVWLSQQVSAAIAKAEAQQ